MLPDWCQPFLKPFAAKVPPGGAPTAHHVAAAHDPLITSTANTHGHIGIGSSVHHGTNASYSYITHTAAQHHAATSHLPLWAKKAGIVAAACATPPLVLAALARQPPPADPALTQIAQGNVSPQAVPEPSGLLVMPLGVVAIVMLSRRKASKPT